MALYENFVRHSFLCEKNQVYSKMSDLAGYHWLAQTAGIVPIQPFAVVSRLGGVRKTVHNADHTRIETYPQSMRPAGTLDAHLMFAFRYEVLHLEFLARILPCGCPH